MYKVCGRIFFFNDSGLTVSPQQKNVLFQRFLDYQILYLNDNIYSLGRGTAQKNLDVPSFRIMKIAYPKSLSEQKRIVEILDEAYVAIDKAKANVEKNLQNAKELFENALNILFTNKGNGWNNKSLSEIATFRNGMNFTKSSKGEVIKIVGVKDFQKSFWVPLGTLESVVIDGELSETDYLKEGDILAVRSNGNPELIGRTLLAGSVIGKVSHSGFTIRIRLNSKEIFPLYLCHYLKSQKARKELIASGTGVNIKSLNQVALSSLIIPIPKSYEEQKSIVEKLDNVSTKTKNSKPSISKS